MTNYISKQICSGGSVEVLPLLYANVVGRSVIYWEQRRLLKPFRSFFVRYMFPIIGAQ